MTETTGQTPATDIFDLQAMETVMRDEAWLTVTHPQTGAPTPIRIKLAGPDSDAYRAVDRRVKNRNLAASKKSRSGLTIEAIEAGGLDILTGATLGWEGVSWGGSPLAFSPENAKMLYTKFPFIREQVDEFLSDRANFFVS